MYNHNQEETTNNSLCEMQECKTFILLKFS